jgi:hypothetical protein
LNDEINASLHNLCVTSCLPWFMCFHLFPAKQSYVALPHACPLHVPKMFWW